MGLVEHLDHEYKYSILPLSLSHPWNIKDHKAFISALGILKTGPWINYAQGNDIWKS